MSHESDIAARGAPRAQSAEELVLEHRGYATALARQIHSRLAACAEFEEIEAYAMTGLVEAARRYERRRGASFQTFSYRRIRGAVFDGIEAMIGMPESVRIAIRDQGLRDQLVVTRSPSGGACSREAAADALGAIIRGVASSALLSDAAGADAIPDRDAPDSIDELGHAEAVQNLKAALSHLPPEVAQLLQAVHFEGKSLSALARHAGVDKATISRRHAAALELLAVQIAKDRVPAAQRNE